MRPRRSVLYMPGANARALEKARGLDCDSIIFDLEDAVAPDAKTAARSAVAAALEEGGYGSRERVLRINGLDTPWGEADLAAALVMDIDAVLVPKIEAQQQLDEISAAFDRADSSITLWIMVETPRGVLQCERLIADNPRVEVLVMGTSDLTQELRARHTEDRLPMLAALGHCLLVARAHDRVILDGVHLDFRNESTFRAVCLQGRELGFDGKTLIHPSQIDICNEVFGPSDAEVDDARLVKAAWDEAQRAGKGVAVVDGRLVENLHAVEADRVLALVAAIAGRSSSTETG